MATPGETIRALAEAILPSPPDDDVIGSSEIEAERFITHYLEFIRPGLADVLAAALDGAACNRASIPFEPGTFAALERDDRIAVLRLLGEHDLREIRDLSDIATLLALTAYYGEWTGQDASGRMVHVPVGWELTGFPGPS